jgi:uncharacterized SAM-binding protein YcdF (DUF218 family)
MAVSDEGVADIAVLLPEPDRHAWHCLSMRSFLIVCLVLLGVGYVIGVPVFLQRDDDPLPKSADAVVVLAGSDDRLVAGEALVGGGIAPTLVVSTERSRRNPHRDRLCRLKEPAVICVYPGRFGTVSEAKAVSRLAAERGWNTVVVVTSRYTLFRADRTLQRCGDYRVVEYGVDEPWWRNAIGVPLEWIKLAVSETVRRNC